MTLSDVKRCAKCGDVKSLDDFHRRGSGSQDGRSSYCRECISREARGQRAADAAKIDNPPSEQVRRHFWDNVALPDQAGCMQWLGFIQPNGYGKFYASDRRLVVYAHRLSAVIAYGPPASPELVSAHSCRNRDCVAPTHLRWATKTEDVADQWRDGTVRFGTKKSNAKLNDEAVRIVRSSPETTRALAARYGVCQSTIAAVLRGLRWRHVPGGEG